MIGQRQRRIIAPFRYQLSTKLPDHLPRVMMAKCPIIDTVSHLDVLDDQLQEAVDGLLDESQIWGQHDVASIPIFPAFRSSALPMGCLLGRFRRMGRMCWLNLFHDDRVRGAALDANQG